MTLTNVERIELERRISSRTGRADDARRARCIVLLARGCELGTHSSAVAVWRQLYRPLECPLRRGAAGGAL